MSSDRKHSNALLAQTTILNFSELLAPSGVSRLNSTCARCNRPSSRYRVIPVDCHCVNQIPQFSAVPDLCQRRDRHRRRQAERSRCLRSVTCSSRYDNFYKALSAFDPGRTPNRTTRNFGTHVVAPLSLPAKPAPDDSASRHALEDSPTEARRTTVRVCGLATSTGSADEREYDFTRWARAVQLREPGSNHGR